MACAIIPAPIKANLSHKPPSVDVESLSLLYVLKRDPKTLGLANVLKDTRNMLQKRSETKEKEETTVIIEVVLMFVGFSIFLSRSNRKEKNTQLNLTARFGFIHKIDNDNTRRTFRE